MKSLPLIRSHEVMEYKRCVKRWYWHWRRGLFLKEIKFGALDLGTWMHEALKDWYSLPGVERYGALVDHFNRYADAAIADAARLNAPDHVLDKASELAALGEAMAIAYEKNYGTDPRVEVIKAELPLEFSISDEHDNLIGLYMLKPDLVYRRLADGGVWLMEHKTAKQIRTEHLVIDGQARPYGVMAERALRNIGVIGKRDAVKGIMYNFLRKALPDERETNAQGQSLNKNGTVSAKQPAANFLRKPVLLTAKAKAVTLKRIRTDVVIMTGITEHIRNGTIDPALLPKTPDKSCPMTCDYFAMCVAEEEGSDIKGMERSMYTVRNPYDYEDTADEPRGFELA